jgi:hypothetical protein
MRYLINAWYTIPALVFVGFFLLSLGNNGPAYLSDEVAYLGKAATIAGSTVHLTSSWFAGYSFMISPAFFISSDPYVEWNIIVALNALMWATSAFLLQYVLRKTRPAASQNAVFFATLGAMLYPSWLSMNGYAFATSGFVVVFMAALAAIVRSRLSNAKWLLVASGLGGYLCWIHPLGFLFMGLFAVLLIVQGLLKRRPAYVAISFAGTMFSLAYLTIVHPWLGKLMSGSLVNDSHYTQGVADMIGNLLTADYWLHVTGLFIGLLMFAAIASFGLVIYGSIPIIRNLFAARKTWKTHIQSVENIVPLMAVALVAGVIAFTALSWGINSQLRIDQWVYGRYTDMFILPLIGLSLLAGWRLRSALVVAGLVIAGGVALSAITNAENTLFAFNNKVNIQALWSMHIASVVHANHYWVWGLVGAAGIIFCGFFGRTRYKPFLILLLIPIALAGVANSIYNRTVTQQHASVSNLYNYVRTYYSEADCIGFAPDADSHERFNLYSYYLHGYDIRKMTLEQWQQQDCQGPYFTYDPTIAVAPSLEIKGVEASTNLYMVTRTGNALAVQSRNDEAPIFFQNKMIGYAIIFR